MKTLLKVIAALIGIIVLVIVVAAIAIPIFFDPNDYKQEIATAVRDNTGRDFQIEGDIGLSVFPWLGMDLGTVELGNAPVKYDGLAPWEIFLSEAQERMTLMVPPEKWKAFSDLAKRRSVEATDLGEFTDSGLLEVSYNGNSVARLDLELSAGMRSFFLVSVEEILGMIGHKAVFVCKQVRDSGLVTISGATDPEHVL